MLQMITKAESDVRMDLGIALGIIWIGKRWNDEERDGYFREKYPQPKRGVQTVKKARRKCQ